jgi:hypothetical protein
MARNTSSKNVFNRFMENHWGLVKILEVVLVYGTTIGTLLLAHATLKVANDSKQATAIAERTSRAYTFVLLRDRYHELYNKDIQNIRNEGPITKGERSIIKRYWYQAFDEWYVWKQMRDDGSTWKDFYEEVIKGAINKKENRKFHEVFCELRNSEFRSNPWKSFADMVDDFATDRCRRSAI